MAIRTIITEPNKLLRQVSKPVEAVGSEEQKLMNDMLDTMYDANGIGLAAIQIGVPKRIIVMDISKDENKKEPRYFVNPVIKNKDPLKATYEEGCLSVPNQFAEIDRPSKCEVEYLDFDQETKLMMKIEHGIKEASTEIFLYQIDKNNGTIQSNPELIQNEMGKIVEYFAESTHNLEA